MFLFQFYMDQKKLIRGHAKTKNSSALFRDYQNLQRICSHPIALKYNRDRYSSDKVNYIASALNCKTFWIYMFVLFAISVWSTWRLTGRVR